MDLPGVHKDVEHGCRFVQLQELHSLSWQAVMPQGDQHVHFSLDMIRGLGERLEQRQSLPEMRNRFDMS